MYYPTWWHTHFFPAWCYRPLSEISSLSKARLMKTSFLRWGARSPIFHQIFVPKSTVLLSLPFESARQVPTFSVKLITNRFWYMVSENWTLYLVLSYCFGEVILSYATAYIHTSASYIFSRRNPVSHMEEATLRLD